MALFSWLNRPANPESPAEELPAGWAGVVARYAPGYDRLDDAERARLHGLVARFAREKTFEGCGGLAVTDEMRAAIAAQACLPILGLSYSHYDRVRSILVYPGDFEAPAHHDLDGLAGGEPEVLSGETHYRGPVVLSWDDIRAGGDGVADGASVVIHEFAHVLDDLDGAADGTPPLENRAALDAWGRVLTAEFKRLQRAAETDEETLLDPYGAESPAEFFAVASECFFTRPRALAEEHAALYDQLRGFYRQDPATRAQAPTRGRTSPGPAPRGHAARRSPRGR